MSKRKLLLADDSITIQKVVNLTFADEGIEVIAVSDGNSAMDKLREDSPDLVMADVNMPGLNGYEICEKIKQGEAGNGTPVILLVGSFEPFDEDEARRVGADDYLTKPFQSISQLVEKVSYLLDLEGGIPDEELDDTAEMPYVNEPATASEETASAEEDFAAETSDEIGDLSNEYDDEMIQTDQVGSLPIDETVKYETASELSGLGSDDEEIEEYSVTTEVEEIEYRETEEYSVEYTATGSEIEDNEEDDGSEFEDHNQTQPLTQADLRELSLNRSSEEYEAEIEREDEETPAFGVFEPEQDEDAEDEEVAYETEVEEMAYETEVESEETISYLSEDESYVPDVEEEFSEGPAVDLPMPEAASILSFDEENPLDLPPLEGGSETESTPEFETAEAETAEAGSVESNETTVREEVGEYVRATEQDISDEMVEAITQKVMDRLSEKAVREIAWEVVPQMADLIIKKMAEEKMKE